MEWLVAAFGADVSRSRQVLLSHVDCEVAVAKAVVGAQPEVERDLPRVECEDERRGVALCISIHDTADGLLVVAQLHVLELILVDRLTMLRAHARLRRGASVTSAGWQRWVAMAGQ